MKTLTEFAALVIKNAAKTKAELVAAGKTPEELPAALGEALKMEGDRLTHLVNLLEIVGDRTDDLKRGLALAPASEAEKIPDSVKKVGDHHYSVEFYPPIPKKMANGRIDHGRGGRDGGRGDKRGGKGGRDRKGRGGRGGRDGEKRGEGGRRDQRDARGPRGPRADGPQGPHKPMKVVLPKKPAAPTETPAPAAETPSSETTS